MIEILFPTPEQRAIAESMQPDPLPQQKRSWKKGDGDVAKNREYYDSNRLKLIDRAAEWQRNNPEKHAENQRNYLARRRAAREAAKAEALARKWGIKK